ncbi:MAG TPA: di-heme oxidoredictase family protein, partial [Gemmatimonadales bacterium]|nr:di-heme oxidoredictase family protein [Gemmatimonadales bacterium]
YQTFSTASLISLLHRLGVEKEPFPAGASGIGLRTSAPVFGLGLVDAVADATLLALADADDRNRDGISGRPNLTADGRVGRFGRKATVASLRAFNDGAFRDEMGITSAAVPTEGSFGGYPLVPNSDRVADPEIGEEALDLTDAFVRLLAPVAPLELTKQARDGRNLFAKINCTGCHVPSLKTGNNPVAALRYREVAAYSDLLLHDMGPELADICRPGAAPAEFRTQPLMGLRLLPHFMHDGRALTVTDAIQAHGGEAARSRDAFGGLSEKEKAAIVAFLNSL